MTSPGAFPADDDGRDGGDDGGREPRLRVIHGVEEVDELDELGAFGPVDEQDLRDDDVDGHASIEEAAGTPDDVTLSELSASADPRVTATRRAWRYRLAVAGGDALVIASASTLAGWVAAGEEGMPAVVASGWDRLDGVSVPLFGVAVALSWLLLLAGFSGYSTSRLGVGRDEIKSVLVASALAAGGLAMFAYLTWTDVPRDYATTLLLGGTLGLLAWRCAARWVVRALRARDAYVVPTVVLGTTEDLPRVLAILQRETWAGYAVQGVVVTDDEPGEIEEVAGVPVVATTTTISDVLAELETQTLVIASNGGLGGPGVRRLMWHLEDSDIEVVVAPYFNDLAGSRVRVRPVAGLPLLQLRQPEFTGSQRILKRVTGLLLGGFALVALLPFLALIAVLIRRDSAGPVLFRQVRVGKDGEEFTCLKFRTMYVDAEERLKELYEDSDGNGLLFKMREDPRVTPVGRWLRRYSLDELPQLVNVVRGEMALVGPRPPLPSEVVQYSADLRRRLRVTPGMTGLWQVSGRSDLSLRESTRLDLYYVDNWSFLFDVEIVLRTVKAVLTGRGAY